MSAKHVKVLNIHRSGPAKKFVKKGGCKTSGCRLLPYLSARALEGAAKLKLLSSVFNGRTAYSPQFPLLK